jgi:hypothetical protein
MSSKKRLILFLIALAILLISIAVLAYALGPDRTLREVIPVTPTYFLPPAVTP